jgi:hypothetical protein
MSETPAEEREREEEPQTPSRKRWLRRAVRSTVARVSAAITLGAALITIGLWLSQTLSGSGPGITITNPRPDAVTQVPCVFTVTGRGSPPAGQALVFSNQQQGTGGNVDSTMYFAIATIDSDTWHVVAQVGVDSTPAGTPFTLTAWLVNADWINYLNQVVNPRPWWGTPGTPPGAKKIQSMSVTRTAGKCPV